MGIEVPLVHCVLADIAEIPVSDTAGVAALI